MTMQTCTSPCEQEQTSGATDRGFLEDFCCDASLGHNPSKTHGCAKRGGRPVTWIGGGGFEAKKLAALGVPVLRDLFKQVFGESTASNNAGWLRRKLSESPDSVHGQCRSRVVRARDSGAAIWNRPLIMLGMGDDEEQDDDDDYKDDDVSAAAAEAEGQGEAGGCTGGLQAAVAEPQEGDVAMPEAAGTAPKGFGAAAAGSVKSRGHRSLKRSCTEASQNLRERAAAAARCSSPSASGSSAPTAMHQDGCISPRGTSHTHKQTQQQHRHHHHTHKQHQHSTVQQPSGSGACRNDISSSSLPGHVIHPDELCDDWVGSAVMVFWPADNRWWTATICGLSTATQQLQLLYSDQTEELLAGQDFCDLLRNGHLALAADQGPPPTSATGYTVSAHNDDQAAAAAPYGDATLGGLSGPADLAAAAAGGDASGALTTHVQSCQLPANLAGSGSMASEQDFARCASASLGVNYAGARVSLSGSGSGSGTGTEFEELAAKRACYEPSIDNSGSDGSNPAEVAGFLGFYGNSSINMAAPEQQQQDPQAAQLGAWFASQQRQQQQLQLQMQANLHLQQQVQMQIQHQVAAHMSMQQAAGQVMQLQQPALSSPFAADGNPVAAATGCAVMPAGLGSPFAAACRTAAAAAAAAAMAATAAAANAASTPGVGVPCQQLQQLDEQQLRRSASPVAKAAAVVGSATLPAMQQQLMQPDAGFAVCTFSLKGCDHVVPEVQAQVTGPCQLQQQQQAAAAARAAGLGLPQLHQRDVYELDDDLAAAAGIDSIDGMEAIDQEALAAACGLADSGGDGLGGDACSSGNNSSLCESMADELAVAGIEAEDAAGYYMFGAPGSPRPTQQQQQLQLQQQVVEQQGEGGCQGLVYSADVQEMVAAAALGAACGINDVKQLAGNGFKVAQAPCESSFAHMFDFY